MQTIVSSPCANDYKGLGGVKKKRRTIVSSPWKYWLLVFSWLAGAFYRAREGDERPAGEEMAAFDGRP